MSQSLRCLSCSRPSEEHFWGGIRLCEDCFKLVRHIDEKNEAALRRVLALSREKLREMIIEHKLTPELARDVSRVEVLTEVAKLGEVDAQQVGDGVGGSDPRRKPSALPHNRPKVRSVGRRDGPRVPIGPVDLRRHR